MLGEILQFIMIIVLTPVTVWSAHMRTNDREFAISFDSNEEFSPLARVILDPRILLTTSTICAWIAIGIFHSGFNPNLSIPFFCVSGLALLIDLIACAKTTNNRK